VQNELVLILIGIARGLIEYALVVLAAWRVTSLLVREDGPFDLLARFRYLIGVRYNELSEPYGTNVVASAFACTWCLSVWIGFLAAGFTHYSVNGRGEYSPHTFFITALSISTLVIWIDRAAQP
jgi:hypothetical protein